MFETDAEVAELQRLFDRTLRTANPHMRSIVTPERRLTARKVMAYMQGTKHVVFATIDENEPRASPLDALFVHGRFTMSTGKRATKVRFGPVHPWRRDLLPAQPHHDVALRLRSFGVF